MSRDLTPDELAAVSDAMKKAGYLSYEEFCRGLRELPSQPSQNATEKKPAEITGK